ncbi:T9SS type A sorting domain-containing protein [Pontibacter sp. G13]|uniref:T9SS type A sorting domain-containing protein n=1 Tax=Pontibacter sp. G13 TaxID=3074898 RepID=UPI00288C19DE|nr:T9SS type A sorting domain-containing protein [Pontibacter sp. G13]WNJ20834.1 T9SS type A sorting domain-containing protein [Pontibacter sp. G13]
MNRILYLAIVLLIGCPQLVQASLMLPVGEGRIGAYQLSCQSSFDLAQVSLSAEVHPQGIALSWSTEVDMDRVHYFTIERRSSQDRSRFEMIAGIRVHDRQSSGFSYLDDQIPQGRLAEYRVKMVFHSGKELFSDVVRISSEAQFQQISMYPNPVSEVAMYSFYMDQLESFEIGIYNRSGQRVARQYVAAPSAQRVVRRLDVRSLRKGWYTLRIESASGVWQTSFVKP